VAVKSITTLDAVNVNRLLVDISADGRSPQRLRKAARSLALAVQPGMTNVDLDALVHFLWQVSANQDVHATDRSAAYAWAVHLST
jgi:hypothetical protein